MSTDLHTFEVFPWNSNFDTGIALIDEQHKKLVWLLNQLAIKLVQDDEVHLAEIFDELTAYAEHHFETEEVVWAGCFPDDDDWLVAHSRLHSSFMPKLKELKNHPGEKNIKQAIEEIAKFLIQWLSFHIIDNDRRMAIVLQLVKKGIPLEDAKIKSQDEMNNSGRLLFDAVYTMYETLSSRTLELMSEKIERRKVEEKLSKANLALEKQAITDQLTGLFNRHHFHYIFEQEIRRARREKRYLTFIMFDIDYFKNLNDYYGHIKGDEALKAVGQKVREICGRPGDFVFRLGGEEFGVVVADQSSSASGALAERIRAEIEALQIPNVKSDVADYLTVSLGMISRVPGDGDELRHFMCDADEKLYQAKAQGRNRVVN